MDKPNIPARIRQLASKWKDGSITPTEEKEFAAWYNKDQDKEVRLPVNFAGDLKALEKSMLDTILSKTYTVKRVSLWPRIAVAAAVLIVVFGAGLYLIGKDKKTDGEVTAYTNDIAPGKNGATLTLANGQKILIKDALAGNIATQSGVKISKTADGQIIYEITNDNSGDIAYNTLSTTRGEQTQVRLPDGTLVFLNAESSLRYPTSFAKLDKRQVSLTGEGYFEVAKDKVHPFVVSAKDQQVEVLGTHFNINAYASKSSISTTLLEGSVKVSNLKTMTSGMLKPGQQSRMKGDQLTVAEVEVDNVTAWKDGFFVFDSENLENILADVSRWYNVEIVYTDESIKKKTFFGSVSKFDNVSKVLKALEGTKAVSFEIKGKQIIVSKR